MFIYKITNRINGKCYIGLDSGPPERQRRWHSHKRCYRSAKGVLYSAMRKYGLENFDFEVIDTACSKDELRQKEVTWIAHYDSMSKDKGYNRTPGGEFNHMSAKSPEERFAIISRMNRKRWDNASDEYRRRHGDKVRKHIDAKDRHRRSVNARRIWNDPEKAAAMRAAMKRRASEPQRIAASIANFRKASAMACKTYRLTDPGGLSYVTSHLPSFCREHSLTIQNIRLVAAGRNRHHKGWKCEVVDAGIS